MKQMVYVVVDGLTVVGVYNDYEDAEHVAVSECSPSAQITPVVVDRTDVNRCGCDTPSEVIAGMMHELQSLSGMSDDEDEDEDEDEYDYEDEDEDEEEEEDDEDEESDSDLPDEKLCDTILAGALAGLMEKYHWDTNDMNDMLVLVENLKRIFKMQVEKLGQ